jgi:hypothetical protein
MEEALKGFLDLVVGGVPLTLSVFVTVQSLKVLGFVTSETAPKAAIAAGGFFGLGYLASALFPDAAGIIGTVNQAVVAALSVGLFYEGAKVLLAKVGINLSSS